MTPLPAATLSEAEVYELADIFIKKHHLHGCRWEGMWGYEDRGEAFRDVIACIVLDTSLVLDGRVPLERWRED